MDVFLVCDLFVDLVFKASWNFLYWTSKYISIKIGDIINILPNFFLFSHWLNFLYLFLFWIFYFLLRTPSTHHLLHNFDSSSPSPYLSLFTFLLSSLPFSNIYDNLWWPPKFILALKGKSQINPIRFSRKEIFKIKYL